MSDVDKLRKEVAGLVAKEHDCETKILGFQDEVKQLDVEIAKDLEANLNRQRQPASINTKRAKKQRLLTKIDEYKLVAANINKKLDAVNAELLRLDTMETCKQLLQQISQYHSLVLRTINSFANFKEGLAQIASYQAKVDSINRLSHKLETLNGVKISDLDMDLQSIIADFEGLVLFDINDGDFYKIETMEIHLKNSLARLNAAITGKRAYSVITQRNYTKQAPSEIAIAALEAKEYNERIKDLW